MKLGMYAAVSSFLAVVVVVLVLVPVLLLLFWLMLADMLHFALRLLVVGGRLREGRV